VKIRFGDDKLGKLYSEDSKSKEYPEGIRDAFLKRVRAIEAAADERDLRALKSIHFEKLKGVKNRYSVRLNDQWRLILRFEKDSDGKTVVLIEINKHYGD
jgi:toxin HigB-1